MSCIFPTVTARNETEDTGCKGLENVRCCKDMQWIWIITFVMSFAGFRPNLSTHTTLTNYTLTLRRDEYPPHSCQFWLSHVYLCLGNYLNLFSWTFSLFFVFKVILKVTNRAPKFTQTLPNHLCCPSKPPCQFPEHFFLHVLCSYRVWAIGTLYNFLSFVTLSIFFNYFIIPPASLTTLLLEWLEISWILIFVVSDGSW